MCNDFLPTGWQTVRLGEVCVFENHKRIPLSAIERSTMQGKYPYYGASGIVDYINQYIFDGEFLLISEDGENLKTRNTPICFKAKGKFWVNNHAHILSEKDEGALTYLQYFFKNLDISPYITGAVQPKLSKGNLEKINIIIPNREERIRLNQVLSSLDDKIENNRQMNATLEQMAQAIFQSWFVDFDPVHASSNLTKANIPAKPKSPKPCIWTKPPLSYSPAPLVMMAYLWAGR